MSSASWKSILGMEIMTALLSWGPILGALALATMCWQSGSSLIFVPSSVLAFLVSYLTIIFVLRLCLPKLQAGVFAVGFNRGFIAWQMHTALARSASLFGVRTWLQSSYVLRFFFWRAMGAKIAFKNHSSVQVLLHDAALITIGANCVLAEGVEISAHSFVGDRLFIAPVKIGAGTFIGRDTKIGPRVTIGENSWIDAGQSLMRKQFPAGSKVKDLKCVS